MELEKEWKKIEKIFKEKEEREHKIVKFKKAQIRENKLKELNRIKKENKQLKEENFELNAHLVLYSIMIIAMIIIL